MSYYRDEQTEEPGDKFKVLSNPNRVRIYLRPLSLFWIPVSADDLEEAESKGCARVGDAGKYLDTSLPQYPPNIRELGRTGLIRMERRGRTIGCRIEPETVKAMGGLFSSSPPTSRR